jgi:outer membrane biosynthesis protein TonB
VLSSARGFITSLFISPAQRTTADAGELEKEASKYAEAFNGYTKQIDGRSLFVIPSAPKRTPPPPPPPPPEDTSKPVAPAVPSRYGGPSIIGLINESVIFNDGKTIRVGQSDGALSVIALNAPWGAKVKWQGGEFDVSLFEKDGMVIPPPGKPPEAKPQETKPDSAKPDDAAKPETPKPDAPKPADPKPGDEPKPDEPKPDAPKPGAEPKPEQAPDAAPKQPAESPKQDAPQSSDPKTEGSE